MMDSTQGSDVRHRTPRIVMDCERSEIDAVTEQRGAEMIVAAILEAGYPAKWYMDEDGHGRVLHQAPDEVFRKAQYLVVVAQRLPYSEMDD